MAKPLSTMTGRRTESRVGITYMLLAMVMYGALDAQGKYLSDFLPVMQIAWSRHLGLFVVVALVVLPRHGLGVLRTRHLGLQLARGVLVVASSILFLTAISFVPLADAVAVSFVAPLVVTVLGVVILANELAFSAGSPYSSDFAAR